MYRKLFLFIVLIFAIQGLYATDVDVKVYVYRDSTIFNYIFNFNQNDSIGKFAVEKPSDAKLDYIVDKNGKLGYDEAGDYYIIKPDEKTNNSIYLKFTSAQVSKDIFETDSYRNYANFNLEADSLSYEIIFKEELGEIINIFPQSYQVFNNERITWYESDVSGENLFIVNFKDASKAADRQPMDFTTFLLILLPSILLFVSLFIIFKKYKELDKIQKKLIKENKHPKPKTIQEDEEINEEIKEIDTSEPFEEIINKHLTENEKDVVLLVKENEGISQYDILNYLPKLTKSNLSKIISKLHSKKILKRIKVGKINNIYLGEKLCSSKE